MLLRVWIVVLGVVIGGTARMVVTVLHARPATPAAPRGEKDLPEHGEPAPAMPEKADPGSDHEV